MKNYTTILTRKRLYLSNILSLNIQGVSPKQIISELLRKAEGNFPKLFLYSEISCFFNSFSPKIRLEIMFFTPLWLLQVFFFFSKIGRSVTFLLYELECQLLFKWRGYTIHFRIQKDLSKYHVILPENLKREFF